MSHLLSFAAALVIVLVAIPLSAQRQWRYRDEVGHYKKIRGRDADAQQLSVYLEAAQNRIPEGGWKDRNLKIYFGLQLADIYIRAGDFGKAENLYLELKNLVERGQPRRSTSRLPFHGGTCYDAYDHLGYFYLRTANYRQAEQVFLHSRNLREKVFQKRSAFRIHPYVGLGSLLFRQGQYDSAEALFSAASQMLGRATTSRYDYDNISRRFLYDLSEIFLLLGKKNDAWRHINELSASSSGFGKFRSKIESHTEVARVLELKARFYLLTRDFQRAQDYLDRANDLLRAHHPLSVIRFRLLKTQALLYWREDYIAKAGQTFARLMQAYREHIRNNFVAMSEYEKEQFYNTLKADVELFNAFAVGHRDQEGSHLLFEEIFNNTLNAKALLLNNTNKIRNNIMRSGDRNLIAKLHEWQTARVRLSSYYYEGKFARNIDSLERRIETLEKEISQASDLFTGMENPATWKQVQAKLNDVEAAVEIIRVNSINSDSHRNVLRDNLRDSIIYLAIILKKGLDKPQCAYLENGNELERRFLPFYRNSVMGQVEDALSYHQFWAPVKRELRGIKRVYLSPDGVFNQVNLNTLRNPLTGNYVIDELELIYVTNTADLLKQKKVYNKPASAVLFGRPLYNTALKFNEGNGTSYAYGTRNLLIGELMKFKEQRFSDLPGTAIEVRKIEETLSREGVSVESYLGEDAQERNVKAVQSPSVLHIATHGFFVDDAASHINPMIRSGLVLAGVENARAEDGEDGVLTAYEATNLDLDSTDLVTLSACETGLGEIKNGQGVYGLQRSIIVAGAQNLLMSLWKVNDEATAELMVEFYTAWGKRNNQSAFRLAQKKLRKRYPQPFYWGAFIMLGQ